MGPVKHSCSEEFAELGQQSHQITKTFENQRIGQNILDGRPKLTGKLQCKQRWYQIASKM